MHVVREGLHGIEAILHGYGIDSVLSSSYIYIALHFPPCKYKNAYMYVLYMYDCIYMYDVFDVLNF